MKMFAVVFRHDEDKKPELISYDNEDESFSWKDTLRIPKDRYIEGSRVGIWFWGNLPDPLVLRDLKFEFYGTLICDDKPSCQCLLDGDTDRNGWHPRMYGDFAIVVDTEDQAKKIMKNPAPMAWLGP